MTYLLTCVCGQNVPVEVGQAGGRVACSCGATLDVPPLRKLRHLPPVREEVKPTGDSWNVRRGVVTASFIIAAALAAATLWIWWGEPRPAKFDPVAHLHNVDEHLKSVTPAESFEFWNILYRPLAERGFSVLQDSRTAMITQVVAQRRFLEYSLLAVAAVAALIAATTAFWPTSTRRV